MTQLDNYLEHLDEDFSFVNKVFKSNIISKMSKGVKDSIKGKRVNKDALQKALKPLPVVSQDKIDIMLAKYLPNFKHNKVVARKHFDKKYPGKPNNETIATASAMIASANDNKSLQDSIKNADKVYSRGGSGGGTFVIILLGLFIIAGAFSIEGIEFKMKALAFALGALLIIAAII